MPVLLICKNWFQLFTTHTLQTFFLNEAHNKENICFFNAADFKNLVKENNFIVIKRIIKAI